MLSRFNVHPLRTAIINTITLAVAVGLAIDRKRNRPLMPRSWHTSAPAPLVEIIVPARNEEGNIERLLDSLVHQHYPADRWGVIVVDDHSTDQTCAIAARYAAAHERVRTVTARDLLPGWTGKNNAMFSGFLEASPEAEYLLFVDADTEFGEFVLSTLVQTARANGTALISVVLDSELRTFWQRLLVPQIGELYALLAGTMSAVNRGDGAAAANGQCMLVRRDSYARYGALPEVRTDVAEDRALAAAMKAGGEAISLEHGEKLGRVKPYATLAGAWTGYGKTLYWASGRSGLRTAAVVLALELYAHLPLWSLLRALTSRHYPHRSSALAHAPLQLLPMMAVRLWVCHLLRVPLRYALAYPLAVASGNALLLYSWLWSKSRRGVAWKGRRYTVLAPANRQGSKSAANQI